MTITSTASSPSKPKSSTASSTSSPTRSPRLPSPPPFTEVQFGPSSPTPTTSSPIIPLKDDINLPPSSSSLASNRRILPGSKSADISCGPPLIPLSDLDSPFQLQEHLLSLLHHHSNPLSDGSTSSSPSTTIPLTPSIISQLTQPPPGIDPPLWLYELTRLLTVQLNTLLLPLFSLCTPQVCPEMRASEWQYLCAVHDPPKACSAIDYSCHTLDWAANTLTSARIFPSRLSLGASGGEGGMRQLQSVIRRLGRIYAHAWWSHRSVFWDVEERGGGYGLFRGVCERWGLTEEGGVSIPYPGLGNDQGRPIEISMATMKIQDDDIGGTEVGIGREHLKTRRHKNSASTGTAVFAVMEEDEGVDKDHDIETEGKEEDEKEKEKEGEKMEEDETVTWPTLQDPNSHAVSETFEVGEDRSATEGQDSAKGNKDGLLSPNTTSMLNHENDTEDTEHRPVTVVKAALLHATSPISRGKSPPSKIPTSPQMQAKLLRTSSTSPRSSFEQAAPIASYDNGSPHIASDKNASIPEPVTVQLMNKPQSLKTKINTDLGTGNELKETQDKASMSSKAAEQPIAQPVEQNPTGDEDQSHVPDAVEEKTKETITNETTTKEA